MQTRPLVQRGVAIRPRRMKDRAGQCRWCGRPGLSVRRVGLPCMSELPRGTKPARLKVGVSPRLPRAHKPATELGAAPTFAVPNPDSRLGLSPHSQGRVMDETSAVFVGIDVSRDRLDVHLRPDTLVLHRLALRAEMGREGSGKRRRRGWPRAGGRSRSLHSRRCWRISACRSSGRLSKEAGTASVRLVLVPAGQGRAGGTGSCSASGLVQPSRRARVRMAVRDRPEDRESSLRL
jgi:hypothetical protein